MQMNAIQCIAPGGPEVLQWGEAPMPVPRADEVLIKVAAAGVNRADLLQRQGKYPPPAGASSIIGLEVAGEVVALGGPDAARWKVGDKVCALLPGGGYAEYVAVAWRHCLPAPPNLSMNEIAALPESIATVWRNVFQIAALKTSETILVHGGASGIGTAAIQIVKLFGAKIFVTVGSEEKADACRKLGADLAINYKKEDFVTAIEQVAGKEGLDAVLDMVGGDYVNRNLKLLGRGGRHVNIATQQGAQASVDMRLIMHKQLTLTGSTLRGQSQGLKGDLLQEIEKKVWPWVISGKYKPLIYKTFPIKNASEAHKMMESGAHIGKIILEVAS